MKKSAGILLYRIIDKEPEFLLVHPGGPFWKNKDVGAWSIPKGEFADDEEPFHAAIREMKEETGVRCNGDFIELAPVKQQNGKLVYAWALAKDIDATIIKSNTFKMEWPPKSGKYQEIPEIDKAAWFNSDTAKQKIIPAQAALIDELLLKIK